MVIELGSHGMFIPSGVDNFRLNKFGLPSLNASSINSTSPSILILPEDH